MIGKYIGKILLPGLVREKININLFSRNAITMVQICLSAEFLQNSTDFRVDPC